mgnify:CR=1 FL=1
MPGGVREGGAMTDLPQHAEVVARCKRRAAVIAQLQREQAQELRLAKKLKAAERRGKDG